MSDQGLALENVYIRNYRSGQAVITDYSGYFSISDPTMPGDTLIMSRIGYETVHYPLTDSLTYLTVKMTISVLPMEEVIKVGYLSDRESRTMQLRVLKTLEMGNVDNTVLLRHVPGMSIKSYGGPAGISTASLDGGPASHTKILISGFDLTSAQNGQVDISQIPAPMISSVSLIPVNISRYGSGAIDGVLSFNPWSGHNALSISAGSFGHFSGYGMVNVKGRSWNLDVLGGYRQDEGNYAYTTFLDTLVHTRKNNDFKQYYGSARFSGILKNDMWYRAYYLESHQDRGVAGLSWSILDTLSQRRDHYRILTGETGWNRGHAAGRIQLLFRDSYDEYTNPYLHIESAFGNRTYDMIIEQTLNYKQIDINMVLENKFETLNNTDTLYKRNTLMATLSGNVHPVSWLQVQPAVHLDYYAGYDLVPTGEIGLAFPVNRKFLKELSLHAAFLFRYPTFNDLYWEPGGNPDLLPEKTQSYTLFAITPITPGLALDWEIYEKRSHDLIVWMPQASYWTPKNVELARQNGVKIALRYAFPRWDLSGKIAWNETHSANLSEGVNYGKPLRYVPERSGFAILQWTPVNFTFLFQASYTDKKIVMYGYPDDTELPAICLLNTSMSYRIAARKMNFIPVLAVDNLADIRYETIQGYPEPGRTWRLTLSMEW